MEQLTTKFNPQFWQNRQFGRGKVGLPHMGLTKIRKSGYGPDGRVKKTLDACNTFCIQHEKRR